jgi:hypothetical protein
VSADGVKNAKNTRGRPFAKGNPGKPKGARHKRTLIAERLPNEQFEEVITAVYRAARDDRDMAAARILCDRLWPVRKVLPAPFSIQRCTDARGIIQALGDIIQAVACGELTIDEGQGLAALLDTQRKTIETQELQERIEALEARTPNLGTRTWPQ